MLSNTIRFGKDGLAGAFDDQWLPIFGGELLTAFDEHLTFAPLVRRFTMTQGNEMKFPNTWRLEAEYHQAGSEMLGLDHETKETTIKLDDRPLVSHFELDDIDQSMAHFEIRSELARQAGLRLARLDDFKTSALLLKASQVAAPATGSFPGGGATKDGVAISDADLDGGDVDDAAAFAFLNAINTAVVSWANQDAPMEGRWAACQPNMWFALRRLGLAKATAELGNVPIFNNADMGTAQAPLGAAAAHGQVLSYEGVNIKWSNNFPVTDTSASTTHPPQYNGDFSKVRGLVWQEGAMGHLTLLGVSTEQERDVRRQSDFFVAKMLTGGGTLRPELVSTIASVV